MKILTGLFTGKHWKRKREVSREGIYLEMIDVNRMKCTSELQT